MFNVCIENADIFVDGALWSRYRQRKHSDDTYSSLVAVAAVAVEVDLYLDL